MNIFTVSFIQFILAFIFFNVSYAKQVNFRDPVVWNNHEILQSLKTAKIIKIEPMRDYLERQRKNVEFDGEVFFVLLSGGMKAVFKSNPLNDQGDAEAEVAAYNASLYLKFPFVPPTVLRKINHMQGSLQLFVETPVDLLSPGIYKEVLSQIDRVDEANLRIFHFVFGQWDSGPHNILAYPYKGKTYLIAIDNAGIRNRQHVIYGDLPFIRIFYSEKFATDDWNEEFPFDKAQVISDVSNSSLRRVFGNILTDEVVAKLQRYQHPMSYVIYRNALWKQYNAFNQGFIKPYTELCPIQTLNKIKSIDIKVLRKIFGHVKSDFLTSEYLKAILDRRDQVIAFCDKKMSDL